MNQILFKMYILLIEAIKIQITFQFEMLVIQLIEVLKM